MQNLFFRLLLENFRDRLGVTWNLFGPANGDD